MEVNLPFWLKPPLYPDVLQASYLEHAHAVSSEREARLVLQMIEFEIAFSSLFIISGRAKDKVGIEKVWRRKSRAGGWRCYYLRILELGHVGEGRESTLQITIIDGGEVTSCN
jgi:hypothetical protein